MTKRELVYCALKVIFLFGCILFRILLGTDEDAAANEALLIQNEVKVFGSEELIKDVTPELILKDSIVCGLQ